MSMNRGIFESFPNQPAARQDSPFAVVSEPVFQPVASPFTAVSRQESPSPFTVVDELADARQVEPGKPARLPERRKIDSPFQVAEPTEGFGFEAPPRAYAASPFEIAPPSAPAAPAPAPFALPPQPHAPSPFSVEPARDPSQATQAAIAAFSNWQESQIAHAAAPAPAPVQAAVPSFDQAAPLPFAVPAQAPASFAPAPAAAPQQAAAPAPTPAPAAQPEGFQSDSFSIRQLELRAIFGVDREMSADEILQRARALPGVRNIARVGPQDMATIEALKHLLPNLGFGSGSLKLYAGSVPLEFIRESSILLAVQTDGGFAPGVRETLMIVARELGRMV